MATPIKGNLQNETIALLLASAQLLGHGESWIQAHSTPNGSDDADYAYIMEWISQCFVLESVGDVASVASQLIPGTLPPPLPKAAAAAAAPKSAAALNPPKMNWAATAAAPRPQATAAAAVTTPSKIRLLVTNNKGKNTTQQNTAFSTAFVKVLNDKIKQDGAYYSGANLTKGVDDLMRVVVQHGWPRVASKITKIKEALTPPQQVQGQGPTAAARLNSVIDLWGQRNLFKVEVDFVAQAAPATGPKKNAQQILAEHITTLKGHAEKVINVNAMAPTPNTLERKLDILRDTCNSCKHLLMALDGVLKRNTAPPMPPSGLSLDFLKKVRRRLWRVLRYSSGPQKFLIKGKTILTKKIVEAKGNPNLIVFEEPVWVAKDPKLNTLFSTSPPTITVSKEAYINWFKTEFTSKMKETDQTKKAIATITRNSNNPRSLTWKPSLHCEVALLTYLYLTDTKIISNAIGVSKLNCYACNVYTAELETAGSGVHYIMTGTSGKTHHQWLIPDLTVFSSTSKAALKAASSSGSQKVRTECMEDIRSFLANTGRRNSTGSDSSTGSGGMDANAVFLLGPRN